MANITTTNIKDVFNDLSDLGEFLKYGIIEESDLSSGMYNVFNRNGGGEFKEALQPDSDWKTSDKSFSASWSEKNKYYSDSGNSVITGSNLKNKEKAIVTGLSDKGSAKGTGYWDDGGYSSKYSESWDTKIKFTGFNPYNVEEFTINSVGYSYNNNGDLYIDSKKVDSYKEGGSFKFDGALDAKLVEYEYEADQGWYQDDEYYEPGIYKDGYYEVVSFKINSFNDKWSDSWSGYEGKGSETGSINIASKEGLSYDGEKISGNLDKFSWSMKGNEDGVAYNHSISMGSLNELQLNGLENMLNEAFNYTNNANYVNLFGSSIRSDVIDFLLGGDDTLTGDKKAPSYLYGGKGNDTYIIQNEANLSKEFLQEDADGGNDTLNLKFNFGKENKEKVAYVDLDNDYQNFEKVINNTNGTVVVAVEDGEVTLKKGESFAYLNGGEYALTSVKEKVFGKVETLKTTLAEKDLMKVLTPPRADSSAQLQADKLVLEGKSKVNFTVGETGIIEVTGNAGANVLSSEGAAQAVAFKGSAGNDTYKLFNAGDTVEGEADLVVETSGKKSKTTSFGKDTVEIHYQVQGESVGLKNGDGIENLVIAEAAGQTGETKLKGNELANTITGNSNNNIIDGGAGKDTLIGGAGNDKYYVDLEFAKNGSFKLQDVVKEKAGEGDDSIILKELLDDNLVELANAAKKASTITLAKNVETLDASLTGTLKINLTGNGSKDGNTLIGNDGDNVIKGGAGDDVLVGGGGTNTLTGGKGKNTFVLSKDANDTITDLKVGDTIKLDWLDTEGLTVSLEQDSNLGKNDRLMLISNGDEVVKTVVLKSANKLKLEDAKASLGIVDTAEAETDEVPDEAALASNSDADSLF